MRLIDADALQAKVMMEAPDFMDGGSSITKAFIMAMIKTRSVTPTIDAVPVIRCKDCKHILPKGFCHKHSRKVADDWFCADGERRE
jgi:hypothetical protein